MNITSLARTKGMLEIILVLKKDTALTSSDIINRVSISRDTFYRAIEQLRDIGVVKRDIVRKHVDGADRDFLMWTLTTTGAKIGMHLDDIQKLL